MHYLLVNIFCALTLSTTSPNAERAQQTLDALYKYYAAPNTCLLRENYPSDQNNKATYLASEEQAKRHNEYSSSPGSTLFSRSFLYFLFPVLSNSAFTAENVPEYGQR